MPIFTRRSRASTLQIISARLSENGTLVTFALDTSFLRHTSTLWEGWLRRCGGSVFWFLGTILTLMPETALVSFRTLAFFFPLVIKYLFLLQRHWSPFDSWPLLLFQFSRAWRQSFVIGVFDPYFSSPLSSIIDKWAWISSDESPCRTIPIQFFWVAQTHIFSMCTDFPRYHRRESLTLIVELRPITCRIPEHYHHEEWLVNRHQDNPILHHERQ